MNQEKFVKNYIDLLSKTLSEAIQKNLTILAERNVFESELNEIRDRDDGLVNNLRKTLVEKENLLNDLKNQLNDARKQKEISSNENNELKKNIQHIDVFKKELVNSRTENEKLTTENNSLKDKVKSLSFELEQTLLKVSELEDKIQNSLTTLPQSESIIVKKPSKTPTKKTLEKGLEDSLFVKDAGNF